MMIRALIRFAVLFAILMLPIDDVTAQVAGTPVASPASNAPTLVFQPQDADNQNFFDIELSAGKHATLSIVIGNGGAEQLDVITYAADAYTIRNGGFGLFDEAAQDTGTTQWLDYSDEALTLEPGEMVDRTFAVTVPEGTEPGEYMTGIALETANPLENDNQEGMFQIDQYVRSVRAIRVTVPGTEVPALELGDVSIDQDGATPAIVVDVANTGNVLLTPKGNLDIRDTNGQILLSAPVQMGPVYAGHRTTLWVGLSAPIPEGTYQANVTLSDDSRDVTATLENAELAVQAPTTPTDPAPITISAASVEPGPNADNVQFAVVNATISNTGEPIGNAQLSLVVSKDGEEIERFPISQALSLQQGDTNINTRYIPLEGWSEGEWTFELLLEQVEDSGAAIVVASQSIEGSVIIP